MIILDAAEKSTKFFINNNYTQYNDHWISYAVNELTKYKNNKEYFEFGLKNLIDNISMISGKDYTSHINFEMLNQCYELYNRILENNIDIEATKDFSLADLKKIINTRANFQLNSYFYPEIAMFFNNPQKYCNTFFIRQNGFRIRIDDIQHSILGYYYYLKNFNTIYN